MANKTPQCPRCDGTMIRGLIVDNTYGATLQQTWIAGVPTKGWLGDKMPKGLKVKVATWRCDACGYLESYATGIGKK